MNRSESSSGRSKKSRRTSEDDVRHHKRNRDHNSEFERVKVKEEPLSDFERIQVKEEPVSDFEDHGSRRGRSHNEGILDKDGDLDLDRIRSRRTNPQSRSNRQLLDKDGDYDVDRRRPRIKVEDDSTPPNRRQNSRRPLVVEDGDYDIDRRRPQRRVDNDTPPSNSRNNPKFVDKDGDYDVDRRREDTGRRPRRRDSPEPQERSNNSRRRQHSRSRSPDRRDRDRSNRNNPELRNERGNRGRGGRRNDDNRDRGLDVDSNGRPRDPVREGEWNHFFHPDTVTSSSSSVKVKKELTEHEKYGLRPGNSGQDGEDDKTQVEKEKPNFGLSGKLTAETNTFRGVVIKYSEPPEARKPNKFRWRLYPFKEDEVLPVMYIHRQSAYLLGRDRKIADIPIDHPSCSKQHAAIQYRLMPYERANGTKGRRIKPYIIDLESANGTFVNGDKIESKRYVELFEKDALKFGFSSREYILLHENSKDDPLDDEVGIGSASPLPAIRKEEKPNLGNLS